MNSSILSIYSIYFEIDGKKNAGMPPGIISIIIGGTMVHCKLVPRSYLSQP